ncbi:enhancer of polycomb homolog 1 [Strongylocentrotus purpuratus]|uniref:Enhancer of polycomb-like protein n=1 Tax=Strongylocentrotus purpuratus TaxID=7668 RepID=A0A7M7REN7_STRPU|nr:enhancer of polycomb homolog 1 [Strongylocentrotus purpuratus]|eukprot:XP_786911.3 PREDICTED: enhancer of polycomb homolog 1 [Strongylocentrotus purpuratus]
MSKLSFRARAPDPAKPMPIYTTDELPDLPDFSTTNRAVPQMPTGMEKEEESEHHLQRAISAQQVYGSANHLVIPTPEVLSNQELYENLYEASYKQNRQYIHVQPLSMEQDIPDYDMDSGDERWLNEEAKLFTDITPIKFEIMMDRLEKGSGQRVMNLKDAKALLKEDDDLIIAVYDYWLNKRVGVGHSLIPEVKQEKRDGSTSNNPYVAFRRRTEKMQTRKNRKNDEVSYEKMLKLKRDLSKAVTLLEMVKRREKSKRENLHLTIEIFEKRYQMDDFSGTIFAECEELSKKQPSFTIPAIPNGNQYSSWGAKDENLVKKKREYKKRKHKTSSDKPRQSSSSPRDRHVESRISDEDTTVTQPSKVQSLSDQEEENDPDGIYAFRRKKGCNYHAPNPELVCGWPWSEGQHKGLMERRYRYCCTSIRRPRKCIGFGRRRIGRGGRIILDRARTMWDDELDDVDEHMYPRSPSPVSSSDEEDYPVSPVDPRPSQTSLPLSQLLEEIKAKRISHFRPKTPPPSKESQSFSTYPSSSSFHQSSSSLYPSLLSESIYMSFPERPTTLSHATSLCTPTLDTASTSAFLDPSLEEDIIVDVSDTPATVMSTLELNSEGLESVSDTLDIQSMEVDVVGQDGTPPDLNVSFTSLPRSKFSLEPSVVKVLSQERTAGVPLAKGSVPNHVQVEDTNNVETDTKLKAPQGHSTAPADTVLQLNFPLPPPSGNKASSLLASLSQSSRLNDISQDKSRTNSLSDSCNSLLSSTNKNSQDDKTIKREGSSLLSKDSSQSSGVSSSASSLLSMGVKRVKNPGNDVDAKAKENHEENAAINQIPSNKSVPMEVT